MKIERLHHIAIICSNYEKSKKFYKEILGFDIDKELYREERQSFKLYLSLNGQYLIKLFSFLTPPSRLTRPEAIGLRHIAFGVRDIEKQMEYLKEKNIETEEIRIDEYTNKKFTFIRDPVNLPIEFYEI